MENILGLNEHHYNALASFLRFARYQRTKRLRAIESCFQDIKDTRLQEEEITYTSEEVREIVDELAALVHSEVEAELINAAHTSVVLLRQMCAQAQQWYLRLQPDITQLEDRELLEKVNEFEEQELSGGGHKDKLAATSAPLPKLAPLEDSQGPIKLLHKEIEAIKEENSKLKAQLQQIESQTLNILEEKSRLKQNLIEAESELKGMRLKQGDSSEDELVSEDLARTKWELEKDREHFSEAEATLKNDLAFMQQKYLETQAQLQLAEMELEKKFSQTVAYSNMKKMLTSKNDQIKELRSKLATYEAPE